MVEYACPVEKGAAPPKEPPSPTGMPLRAKAAAAFLGFTVYLGIRAALNLGPPW